jgi:hypothetical protein
MRSFLLAWVLTLATSIPLWSQSAADTARAKRLPVGSDGIPVGQLPAVLIERPGLTKAQQRELQRKIRDYEKLRRNIQLVYPLARACSEVITRVNTDLAAEANPAERKKYLQQLEKEMFERYESRIRNLTLTQGKLLIKLIDRECGASAFALIDEYRSWRSAAFWQLVAGFFGASLKSEYDPQQEPLIEHIVREIERGEDQQFRVVYH